MAGVNKVILVGNLGADPEKKVTADGRARTSFRIATTERWSDKNGQKQEKTEWHNVVSWGNQAELCSQYLSKGRQVYIEGRLRTRKWEADGQTKYITEIHADRVQFLGAKGDGSHETSTTSNHDQEATPGFDPNSDDVPF